MHEQWKNMLGSTLKSRMRGEDPLRSVDARARFVSPEVALSFQAPEIAKRQHAASELLANSPKWQAAKKLYDANMEVFKTRNAAPLKQWHPDLPEDELALLSMQMVRTPMAEEDQQTILDALAEVGSQLKAIDPMFDVNEHAETAYIARSMSKAAQRGAPGQFDIQAPEEKPATTAVGRTFRKFGEGFYSTLGAVGNGLTQLGIGVIEGFDSDFYAHFKGVVGPDEFYEDRDGRVWHNGGKIGLEGPYLAMKLIAGASAADIQEQARNIAVAKELDERQVKGIEGFANAIAGVVGGLAGFGASGGNAAIAASTKLMHKGAARLMTATTPKMSWVRDVLVETGGQSLGTAMWEATAYGSVEGYGKAFIEGLKMGPVFTVAGRLGRHTEKLLESRKRMPVAARRAVAGMVEGLTLSASELTNFTSSLWRFMQERSPEATAEWTKSVIGNVFGMALFKAAHGKTPSEMSRLEKALGEEGFAYYQAREGAGELIRKIARETEDVVGTAERIGVSRETLQSYKEALAAAEDPKAGKEARKEARERAETLEEQLAVERSGGDKTSTQRAEERIEGVEELERTATELEGLAGPMPEAFAEKIAGQDIAGPMPAEAAKAMRPKEELVSDAEREALMPKEGEKWILPGQGEFKAPAEEAPSAVRAEEPKAESPEMRAARKLVKEAEEAIREDEFLYGEARPIKKAALEQRLAEVKRIEGIEKKAETVEQFADQVSLEFQRLDFEKRGVAEKEFNDLVHAVETGGDRAKPLERLEKVIGGRAREIAAEMERLAKPKEEPAMMRAEPKAEEPAKPTREETLEAARQVREDIENIRRMPAGRDRDMALSEALRHARSLAAEGGKHLAEAIKARVGVRPTLDTRPDRFETPPDDDRLKMAAGPTPPSSPKPPTAPSAPSPPTGPTPPPTPTAGKPKSLDMTADLQIERVGNPQKTRLLDIRLEAQGKKGDAVRVPMRKGVRIEGVSSQGILGWYEWFGNVARTRGGRAVAETLHEFSHGMELAARKKGTWDWNSITGLEEWDWRQVASTYPGLDNLPRQSRLSEGWAEFWAREMMEDPRLPEEVPDLLAKMTRWLHRPENVGFKAKHDKLKQLWINYRDQGAVARGEAEIIFKGDEPSEQEKAATGSVVKNFARALDRGMLDDVAFWKEAQKEWLDEAGLKEEQLPITLNPVRLMDTVRMLATRVSEEFMRTGTTDLAGRPTGEAFEKIIREVSGGDEQRYRDFMNYLVSKRSLELIDRWSKTIDNPNVLKYLTTRSKEDYLATVEALETPEFIDGANRIRQWATNVLQYATEAGSLTEKERDRIEELNLIYIPFQRMLSYEAPRRAGPGRGFAERGSGLQEIRGAQEEIRDPVEALRDSTRGIITKAHQAMVTRALYLQHMSLQGIGGLVTRVARDVEPRQALFDQVQKAIKKEVAGEANEQIVKDLTDALAKEIGADTALTFFFQSSVPHGSRAVFAVRPKFREAELDAMKVPQAVRDKIAADEGKVVWLEVDPRVYEVLMGIDAPKIMLDNAPSIVRSVVLGPTKLARWGYTILNPFFVARNLIRDPLASELFTQSGKRDPFLGFGRFFAGAAMHLKGKPEAQRYRALGLEGVTVHGTEIAPEIRRGGANMFMRGMRKFAEWMGATESWSRIKEFKDVYDKKIKEGHSDLDATFEGMLAAKEITGNFTRNGVWARQLNQLYPYFTPNIAGKRKFWRTVLGYEGKHMQAQALIRGFTNIGGLSALVWWLYKDEDWYQELPDWRRQNYWTIDFGGDRLLSFAKPFELGQFFGSGTEAVLEALFKQNPELAEDAVVTFLASHLIGYPWIPQGVLPMVEGVANFSFGFRHQIVPAWMEAARLPEDQYSAQTTEFAKLIGRTFKISPMKFEHVVSQYAGSMPRMTLRLMESIVGLRKFQSELIPGLGAFTAQSKFEQSKSVDRIYEIDKLLTQKSGSKKIAPNEESARPIISAAKREISELKQLARDGLISPEDADRRAAEEARRAIKTYEEIVK